MPFTMPVFRRAQIRALISILLGVSIITLVINNSQPRHDQWIKSHLQDTQMLELEAETIRPSLAINSTTTTAADASYDLPVGEFPKGFLLKGIVFDGSTQIGSNYSSEFDSYITVSVVKSFSPAVEDHVKLMFNDEYDECNFYATLPAIIQRGNEVEVVQRIWLAQYERMKNNYRSKGLDMGKMVKEWRNTWQENYLYQMRLDSDYNLISPGSILGLPTTTNAAFTYKSDGPMDPRLFSVGEDTFLSFHTWLVDPTYDHQITGRLHMFDMNRNIKRRLKLNTKLHRTEINWIPIDVNGELYYTYSLDPLRVMKCDKNTGDCRFIYEQAGSQEHPFTYSSDHLRGGTPWVLYKYPYYIGVAHNVMVTISPQDNFSVYNANLVVLCVDPWKIVYVSGNLDFNGKWLLSAPVIRSQTILLPFFYPSGLILRNPDVIDVSGHLNDANGHIVRMSSIKSIMDQVIAKDKLSDQKVPPVRAAQQYVLESLKSKYKTWRFRGDHLTGTVEKPSGVSL